MKNQLLIPTEKPKIHKLRLGDVSTGEGDKWNRFSSRPKRSEPILQYPFNFGK